jgi:hypothetical protein
MLTPKEFYDKYNLQLVERWEDPESNWRWYRHLNDPNMANYYASVTGILSVAQHERLKAWKDNVPQTTQDAKMSEAAGLGTYIHELIGKDLQGIKVTEADLHYYHVPLEGLFERWLKIKSENQIEALTLELPVYSQLGFGGTLDFLGKYKGRLVIADFKSGIYSIKTGWQLSAYMYALKEMTGLDVGLVGISIPWNKVPNTFEYTHLDWCLKCFEASFQVWRGLYFNKLAKFDWKYLKGDGKP